MVELDAALCVSCVQRIMDGICLLAVVECTRAVVDARMNVWCDSAALSYPSSRRLMAVYESGNWQVAVGIRCTTVRVICYTTVVKAVCSVIQQSCDTVQQKREGTALRRACNHSTCREESEKDSTALLLLLLLLDSITCDRCSLTFYDCPCNTVTAQTSPSSRRHNNWQETSELHTPFALQLPYADSTLTH